MGLTSRKNHREYAPEYAPTKPVGAAAPAALSQHSHLPGPAPNTAGPHRHDILNKLDPTVDSQSGGVQILGPGVRPSVQSSGQGYTHGQPADVAQSTHHSGALYAPQAGMGNNYGQPLHNSRIANTLDPRVDTTTHGQGHDFPAQPQGNAMMTSAQTGAAPQGAYGPHSSRTANTMDPRVDSDLDGRAQMGAHGRMHRSGPSDLIHPGPAPNTAGPHRSDFLNKLDPTVRSKDVVETGQYRTY
ncbi:hypothetical protein NQ176_g2955 [Zarea fungicola]|uniref:Uncharacterized protein n=1 Tax=Zarea fungicola TaxID=93591 RepID=A0ACC1NLY9_9HYPO|nr:hypothetical protein NQ176_g2955 [Lecanicillium fungicola]